MNLRNLLFRIDWSDFLRSMHYRLGHLLLARASDNIMAVARKAGTYRTVNMATDTWDAAAGMEHSATAVTIRGMGPGTVFARRYTGTSPLITISADRGVVEDVRLVNSLGGTSTGFLITGDRVTLRRCIIDGFTTGIDVNGASLFAIEDCWIRGQSGRGIYVRGTSALGRIQGNTVENDGTDEIYMDNTTLRTVIHGNNCGAGRIEYWAATGNQGLATDNVATGAFVIN